MVVEYYVRVRVAPLYEIGRGYSSDSNGDLIGPQTLLAVHRGNKVKNLNFRPPPKTSRKAIKVTKAGGGTTRGEAVGLQKENLGKWQWEKLLEPKVGSSTKAHLLRLQAEVLVVVVVIACRLVRSPYPVWQLGHDPQDLPNLSRAALCMDQGAHQDICKSWKQTYHERLQEHLPAQPGSFFWDGQSPAAAHTYESTATLGGACECQCHACLAAWFSRKMLE